MERKLWSVLHQHLNVLNGCGISFQLNSLARINHVGPLNHKGAKEYVSILSWKPKIFGEQCWCLRTIYVSHLHSCYYKILHAHGKYSFAQYTVYFSFFFLRLFLLLDLGSLLLSHSAVYTHLEMPGLWDSPWSMGIGNQWVHIPLFLPQAGESQRVLHGMEAGCPSGDQLCWISLIWLSVLVQPSQPLHSCHLGSLPKINYLLMCSSVLMLCVLGKPGREKLQCLCSWNCIPQAFLAPGSDGFSFFTMPSVARVAACYVSTVLEFDFLATAALFSVFHFPWWGKQMPSSPEDWKKSF